MKNLIKNILASLYTLSLKSAAKEEGLCELSKSLERVVPDITDQYSTFSVDSEYLRQKVRNMHAFQMSLVKLVYGEFDNPGIADIGDSSGTHLQYLSGLYSGSQRHKYISINLDAGAVRKIEAKGFRAISKRAEDLDKFEIDSDIILCFETLEHISDPSRFLHNLSVKTCAKYLIVSVPYVRTSRVGLHHIRSGKTEVVGAERTHIFELNPEDWKLIIRHSGWEIVKEKIYLQYPRKNLFCIMRYLWKRFDFEGFYGLVLKRNDRWSSKYGDW